MWRTAEGEKAVETGRARRENRVEKKALPQQGKRGVSTFGSPYYYDY